MQTQGANASEAVVPTEAAASKFRVTDAPQDTLKPLARESEVPTQQSHVPVGEGPAGDVISDAAPNSCGDDFLSDSERRYAEGLVRHRRRVDQLRKKLKRHKQLWMLPPESQACERLVRDERDTESWTTFGKWSLDESTGTRSRSQRWVDLADRFTEHGVANQTVSSDGHVSGAVAGLLDREIHGRVARFDKTAIFYDPSAAAFLAPSCRDASPELFDGTVCHCESSLVLELKPISEPGYRRAAGYNRMKIPRGSTVSSDGTVTSVSGHVCPACETVDSSCEERARCVREQLGPSLPELPNRRQARPMVFWTRAGCDEEREHRR